MGGTLPFNTLPVVLGYSELFLLLLCRRLGALGDEDRGGGVATLAGAASGPGDLAMGVFTVVSPDGWSDELE